MKNNFFPVFFSLGLLLSLYLFNSLPIPARAIGDESNRILKSLSPCLPKSEIVKYAYSVAASTGYEQSQWYLVRSHSSPLLAPSYSILKASKNTCTNFNKLPTLDISKTRQVPHAVIDRFLPFIIRDRKIAWSLYQKRIQQQYPGKSIDELKKIGVFGMDDL